jgi:hypothetical protein
MAINLDEKEILGVIVLDDDAVAKIFGKTDHVFLRGWVLRDRKTKKVTAEYRFHHSNGEVKWYGFAPSEDDIFHQQRENIGRTLATIFEEMARMYFGRSVDACLLLPPEGLSPEQTIDWMVKEGLVTVEKIQIAGGWIN